MATSISSGKIYGTTDAFNITFYATQENMSVANNTSDVDWYCRMQIQKAMVDVDLEVIITINGQRFTTERHFDSTKAGDSFMYFPPGVNVVTVPHNSDGTKTIYVSVMYSFNYNGGMAEYETYWTLDPVPREASLLTAPNFNDEQNPVVSYNNSAGNGATSLVIQLLSEDESTIYATRDLPKTSSSYTISLTDAERTKIRQAASTVNSIPVVYKLLFEAGDFTAQSSLIRTCTIVNATPSITATVTKISDDAGSLTGSSDVLILHYSSVRYTMTYSAKKNASIVSIKATCGSQNSTNSSGTFNNVDSGTFVFYVVDSRGNTNTHTVTRQYVDYTQLTCTLEMDSPTTDGELEFDIVGNYYASTVGSVTNSLVVEYRYSVNEGEYGDWIRVTPSIYNNTYSAHVSITGLNYQDMYRFHARATDKLLIAESGHIPVKTRPVFDWGENDFNFNVPVTFTDGYLKYPAMGIINAMTKTYNCQVSVAAGANYTTVDGSATICGNMLRCYISATRSSAYSGDGANEVVGYVSINHGEKIAGMLNVSAANGSAGAVSSLYTSDVSQTSDTLDFTVNLAAVAGSSTRVNSYFVIPITLNLDKFVEE